MKTKLLAAALALTGSTFAQAQWLDLDVLDARHHSPLPEFAARGDVWIPGVEGQEFKLRLRNVTGERLLAVVSIDGVNVVTGQTASPQQSGYVLEPYATVVVDGWRKSLRQSAAFYFSRGSDAYATRTGRPDDLGVIGVAVFREARPIPVWRDELRLGKREDGMAQREAPAAAEAPASRSGPVPSAPSEKSYAWQSEPQDLGTGHGRRLDSPAREVPFQRASVSPSQVITFRYDSWEALADRGIVPRPYRYGRHPDRPRAFPAGFVPDPRW